MDDGRFVDAGGVKTRYVTSGGGRPVVLLHGAGPGTDGAGTWPRTMQSLAGIARVVVPDLVGFGATERPAGLAYSMSVWLDHLSAFVDAIGVESAAFVGTSFGAALALRFALAHPPRVDRLVLAACPGLSFPLTTALDELWGYEPGRQNMRRVLTNLTYRTARLRPLRPLAGTRAGRRVQRPGRRLHRPRGGCPQRAKTAHASIGTIGSPEGLEERRRSSNWLTSTTAMPMAASEIP